MDGQVNKCKMCLSAMKPNNYKHVAMLREKEKQMRVAWLNGEVRLMFENTDEISAAEVHMRNVQVGWADVTPESFVGEIAPGVFHWRGKRKVTAP